MVASFLVEKTFPAAVVAVLDIVAVLVASLEEVVEEPFLEEAACLAMEVPKTCLDDVLFLKGFSLICSLQKKMVYQSNPNRKGVDKTMACLQFLPGCLQI